MKNSIQLTALFLLSSIGVFAAAPVKPTSVFPTKDTISIQPLHASFGVGVSIENATKGKAFIEITDEANHVLVMDRFSKKLSVQQAYNLSELKDGDYTFTIHSNNEEVAKRVHIYEESAGQKSWFFFQD